MTLTSIGAGLSRVLQAALSSRAATPVATAGRLTLTVGEARAALSGLPSFVAALQRIVAGSADLTDDKVLAEAVLAAALIALPEIAPFAAIANAALGVAPVATALLQVGSLRPGVSGERWTQDTPRTGRRP